MKDITVIGIDIAKNVMQIHGANDKGKVLLKKRLARERFLPFMANLPKCLIGMEACSGAHQWASKLTELGFEVKLMSPRKVKKYAGHIKNDANDAAACAEAVTRQNMTFVPVKTKTQMDIQAIHRVRSFHVKHRTALMNTIRGLLLEAGIAISQGRSALVKKLNILLEPESDQLNGMMKSAFRELYETLKQVEIEINRYKRILEKLADEDESCRRISTLPGVGPITATAVIAKIGNGSEFQKGRELSAYLGLVPKQYSSGEKQVLGRISKNGDRYIRQLLVHGGRSSLWAAMRKNKITGEFLKQDEHSVWMRSLAERVGMNKASVAVANKNARIIVALLKNETVFQAKLAH